VRTGRADFTTCGSSEPAIDVRGELLALARSVALVLEATAICGLWVWAGEHRRAERGETVGGAIDAPRARRYWDAAYRSILRFRASMNSILRRRYSTYVLKSFGTEGVLKSSNGMQNVTAE
jgi:hypothetical protein